MASSADSRSVLTTTSYCVGSSALAPYQVNAALLELADPDAVFMHCLPAHRGEEVTADVIDGPRSVVWQQAENRLPTEEAILYALIAGRWELPQR